MESDCDQDSLVYTEAIIRGRRRGKHKSEDAEGFDCNQARLCGECGTITALTSNNIKYNCSKNRQKYQRGNERRTIAVFGRWNAKTVRGF